MQEEVAVAQHWGRPSILDNIFRRSHGRVSIPRARPTSISCPTTNSTLAGELYRGLVAHEITHAVLDQNLFGKELANTAQEYIACAMQISVYSAAVHREA